MAPREMTGRPFVILPSNTHSPSPAHTDTTKVAGIYFQTDLHKLVDTVLVPHSGPLYCASASSPADYLQLIAASFSKLPSKLEPPHLEN